MEFHRFHERLVDRNERERNSQRRSQTRGRRFEGTPPTATFTYEAGTRGNDRELQLPGVTCILHPPRHDDPLLSLSPSLSLSWASPSSMNFHSNRGGHRFPRCRDRSTHSILDRSANSYRENRTCLRRHCSHNFIVDSSSSTMWVYGVRRLCNGWFMSNFSYFFYFVDH